MDEELLLVVEQRKRFLEIGSTPGEDFTKIVEMTTKDLQCYTDLVDKAVARSRGLATISREVLLWVKCHQIALHATEKPFIKGRVNRCGKPHCLILRKCQEKEMATHSSILAWKNPWTEESGGLKSMGLHDWACVHEGGGRWVGSNKLVELKKKKKCSSTPCLYFRKVF